MAKRNSTNTDITPNADGFDISGGTTARKLTVTGGDTTITGGGSAVVTFPASTSTLATLALTEEFTSKTLNASVGKGTWTASGTWTLPAHTVAGLTTHTVGSNYTVVGANTNIVMTLNGGGSTTPIAITIDTVTGVGSGLTITNATNFAHAGNLMALTFANTSDTGKGIVITNAGSGNSLDITQKDNTEAVSIKINATQANVTAADTFIAFKSTSGTEGSIAGTASAGVIAYNTFTGSHYTKVMDEDVQPEMLLEVVPGDPGINAKGQLFVTRVCETRGSKAAIGVYGGRNNDGLDLVLSIGTGFITVANTGENIEIGDYLVSSNVRGCAEKQGDDIYRSMTVAKATENVVWEDEETKRISCIYLGG